MQIQSSSRTSAQHFPQGFNRSGSTFQCRKTSEFLICQKAHSQAESRHEKPPTTKKHTHTHTHSSVRCDHMQYRTIEPSRSHKDPALCFHRGKKRGILLKTKPIARIGNDRAVNRHIFKRGLQKSFAIPDTWLIIGDPEPGLSPVIQRSNAHSPFT